MSVSEPVFLSAQLESAPAVPEQPPYIDDAVRPPASHDAEAPGSSSAYSPSSSPERKPLRLPPKIDIRAALMNPPPPRDHVLPGLSTGLVGALVAAGGTGKTFLALQLCADLATGLPLLGGALPMAGDGERKPAKVVLVAAEELKRDVIERLHVVAKASERYLDLFGMTPRDFLDRATENLCIYPLAEEPPLSLDPNHPSEGLEVLRRLSEGARLVVLDPLRQFHGGDENASAVMTRLVQSIRTLAKVDERAVIIAHHVNKWSGAAGLGHTAAASRGSGLTEAIRWQANLTELDAGLARERGIVITASGEEKKYVRLDLPKGNYVAPQPPIVLKRAEGGALLPVDPPGVRRSVQPASKRRRFA